LGNKVNKELMGGPHFSANRRTYLACQSLWAFGIADIRLAGVSLVGVVYKLFCLRQGFIS